MGGEINSEESASQNVELRVDKVHESGLVEKLFSQRVSSLNQSNISLIRGW